MIKHMQSSSAITTINTTTITAASILRTVASPPPLLPHEYLRETLSVRYQECKSCGKRTQLACITCGYCYTCHWKEEEREKKEKIQFEQILPERNDNNNSSSSSTITMLEVRDEISERSDQTKMIIDVFGQKIEPICNYYRCYHKFSLHDCTTHNSCHCKHPVNSIIGVSKNVHKRE